MRLIPDSAHTVYISTEQYSWGMFCFNSQGDLFINSDWGFYGFAWRHFGNDFATFLGSINPDYMVCKLQVNYMEKGNKPMHKNTQKKLTGLCGEFIRYMNVWIPNMQSLPKEFDHHS